LNILTRLFRGNKATEERQSASISDPIYWDNLFSRIGFKSNSNQNVTPDSALQSSAVYACVRVIAETMASLPLMLYKRKGDAKEIADTHEIYYILHEMPNPDQTSFEFFEMMVGHLCLRGNSYAFVERTNGGQINAIYPLNPAKMTVYRNQDRIIYEYTHDDGKREIMPVEMVWHMRGLSSDGLLGLSPISLAREAIGLGLATQEYAARFYSNFAMPGGVLEYPGSLKEDQITALKKAWDEAHTGANLYRTAILQGGLSWKAVGMTNTDQQYIESRNLQTAEIARIFRVPLFMVGGAGTQDKSTTYASAEQQKISFATDTVRPWCTRIEQSISRCLLTAKERKKYYAEFKLEGLLRGDLQSRYTAYATARQWGWLCVNDIRRLENLDPIDEGEEYLRPLNMTDAANPVLPKEGDKTNGDNKNKE